MIHAPFIKDSTQRRRALAPTTFGMNPAVAEQLTGRGIDPRDYAETLKLVHADERLRRVHRGAAFSSAILPTEDAGADRIAAVRAQLGSELRRFAEFALSPNDVRVRQLIQQAALAAHDEDSIADIWCPNQLVDVGEGEIKLRDRATRLQRRDTRVGPRSRAVQVGDEVSAGTYKCEVHSAEATVNRQVNRIAPDIENRMTAAMHARTDLSFNHEIEVAVTLMTSGSYAASNTKTIAAGAQWNGGASADPIDDCQDAIAGCTGHPTHAVMGLLTWQAAQANDELKAIVGTRPDNAGLLRAEEFALYWGLQGVLVSRRQYIDDGASAYSWMYGSASIAFLRVSRNEEERTFMRNYMLRQGAMGYVSTTYPKPDEGGYGVDVEKVTVEKVPKVIDNTYGYLLINARQ